MEKLYFVLFLVKVVQSVDGQESESVCRPTPHDIVGPYYFPRPPPLIQYCTGDPESHRLENMIVRGHVYKADCLTPLPRVRIEVWQADHAGVYQFSTQCRGFIRTDALGYYEFSTIHPGQYTIDRQNLMYRPSHIHFRVFGRRRHKGLITQLYFAGDPYLGRNDSCSICSSGNPDLIKQPKQLCDDADKYCMDVVDFDIVLERGSGTSVTQEGPNDITE
ncbi:hypothetical protein FSP39_013908 [Pinctada imbricata]|uniref:Intradiol ring-cleavage dioxygenases domain-containing protein n=1 Tax=Pinctada imbricata TaxID=66713 RepID=A0AA88XR20_PINIB|nr:hypothetical protein FSP39_013908 [Pinctada imbricata]